MQSVFGLNDGENTRSLAKKCCWTVAKFAHTFKSCITERKSGTDRKQVYSALHLQALQALLNWANCNHCASLTSLKWLEQWNPRQLTTSLVCLLRLLFRIISITIIFFDYVRTFT